MEISHFPSSPNARNLVRNSFFFCFRGAGASSTGKRQARRGEWDPGHFIEMSRVTGGDLKEEKEEATDLRRDSRKQINERF